MPNFRIKLNSEWAYPAGFDIYYNQETDMIVARVQEEGVRCSKTYNRKQAKEACANHAEIMGAMPIAEAIFADMQRRFPGLKIWT